MTFKEQRNEAIARGVGVVRRRYVCAYVVGLRGAGSGFQWEKQPQTDRWGRWGWSMNKGTMEREGRIAEVLSST